MDTFQSRIDAYYSRQDTFQARFQLVWILGFAALYWLWYSTPPAVRVTRFALIFAVLGIIVLLASLWAAWRIRGVINRLRSMAPDERDEVIGRDLPPESREFYEKRLAAEGSVEFNGVVERFPFSSVDRRETIALFWGAASMGGITLAAALGVGDVQEAWRGPALVLGIASVVAMPVLSRRFQRLASVIELTPFAIIEVAGDGRRRWLYWGQPLLLRNRKWLQRADLAPQGASGHIPLHYSRIGFDRLIAEVLERGGFPSRRTPAN